MVVLCNIAWGHGSAQQMTGCAASLPLASAVCNQALVRWFAVVSEFCQSKRVVNVFAKASCFVPLSFVEQWTSSLDDAPQSLVCWVWTSTVTRRVVGI